MKRFALAAALILASVAPADGADCHLSFSPECMKPYFDAARVTAAELGEGTIGGTGAHIPTLSFGYPPLSPKGFRGAVRVTVTGGHLGTADRVK